MPVRNILIRDARGNIEHDDTALAVDVVSITQTTEFLLTCSIPNIELDGAQILISSVLSGLMCQYLRWDFPYGGEAKRVNLYTQSCNVLLLEFAGNVTLHEGCLFFFKTNLLARRASCGGALRKCCPPQA